MIHLFWQHYGCSPEAFYELPLWRMLRQVDAIGSWTKTFIGSIATAMRVSAHGKSYDFSRYISGLLGGARAMNIVSRRSAASFGLGYTKKG